MIVGEIDDINSLDMNLYEKSKKNNQIIYTGSVNEIEKYFCAIDVLLLPSYREGFGNVVIEAAVMGTPAIVSNIPGPIDAVLPAKTGYVIIPKSVDELERAMKEIMLTDYVQMGLNAQEFVRTHFDSEVLCKKIYDRKTELLRCARCQTNE